MPVQNIDKIFNILQTSAVGVAVISMIVFILGSRFYVRKSPTRMSSCCRKSKVSSYVFVIMPVHWQVLTLYMCRFTCDKNCIMQPQADSIILLRMDSTEEEAESDTSNTNVPESCKDDSSTGNDVEVQAIAHSESEESTSNSLLHHDNISAEANDSKTSTATGVMGKLKQLIPAFKILLPLTLFWAIFFQRSSTWILQAIRMDCYLGSLHIPPGKQVLYDMVLLSRVNVSSCMLLVMTL